MTANRMMLRDKTMQAEWGLFETLLAKREDGAWASCEDESVLSLSDRFLRRLPKPERMQISHWLTLNDPTMERINRRFALWAHEAQWPPEGGWRCWLFMGGRGAGKTRAGAEWVRACVKAGLARRVALVGPTLGDVREVMIEGPSGLRSVCDANERPAYNVSRRRLVWPCGVEAFAFSAEDPESLRGPQFDLAWCDEIGAWAHDEATWDMLAFALRLGAHPRVMATTTPRPRRLVKRLVRLAARGDGVAMTRAATDQNVGLAEETVRALHAQYQGTRLERQELEGELIEDPPGALFTRDMIERWRVAPRDTASLVCERVVVAVDPPAGVDGDACGIVAAGLRDGVVYVLADASARGLAPLDWARRAAALARQVGAGRIVAEANQGGEMVREVLRHAAADEPVAVKLRHATRSKRDRAEPVSVMYAQGGVRHAGLFRELEDEMCAFGAEGGGSPDRVDAMVWAVSELSGKRGARPRVSKL